MTMLKVGMMGAALATSLVGGAGKANADVRFGVGPAHVSVSAPRVVVAPPPARVIRPVVVSPAPRRGYDNRYNRHDRYYGGYQYGSTITVYGGGAAQPSWQDPHELEAQIRAEMNQADSDLRFDVRQGAVAPQALANLESDRQEIERDLSEVCGKGYVTADDRAHMEQHVQEIRDLRTSFSTGYGQTAYGYR